jgi:hypothetical protein
VHLECNIMRCGSFLHEERIGKHFTFLIAVVILIFNRVTTIMSGNKDHG